MKKILYTLIASASTLGSVSAAYAADAAPAPYAGVGIVAAKHEFKLANDTSGGDSKSDEWSGKVYGGVQIDKTFAVEGGYTNFGSSNYTYATGAGAGAIDSRAYSFYLAGKGSVPINDQFSMFGKLGVAYNKNTVNATGVATQYAVGDNHKTNLYAAVGAEYAINQKVSLSVEYEHYGKNDIEQGRKKGAVTLGARYNF
jgi:OmpA-OmpF porin, OOP family